MTGLQQYEVGVAADEAAPPVISSWAMGAVCGVQPVTIFLCSQGAGHRFEAKDRGEHKRALIDVFSFRFCAMRSGPLVSRS